jgi:hypothetical protein
MKRVVLSATLLAMLVSPAWAQMRGSGGHAVAAAPARVGMVRTGSPGFARAGLAVRSPGTRFVVRSQFFRGHRFPRPFPSSFCFGNPWFCRSGFYYPWYGAAYYGLPYDLDDDYYYYGAGNYQTQAELAQQQNLISELQDEIQQQRLLEAERVAEAPPSAPAPQARPAASEQPITQTVLVFRDQHREEVGNYAIVAGTLYDFMPHQTKRILLADLDLPATMALNRERGVEFRVPKGQRQVVTRP